MFVKVLYFLEKTSTALNKRGVVLLDPEATEKNIYSMYFSGSDEINLQLHYKKGCYENYFKRTSILCCCVWQY